MGKINESSQKLDADFFESADEYIEHYITDLKYKMNSVSSLVLVALHKNEIIGYVTAEIVMLSHIQYNQNDYCIVEDIMVE